MQGIGSKAVDVVTDNAANMTAMRQELALNDDINLPNIITYRCSAHWATLLAKDIRDLAVLEDMKTVIKYFRNHHDPKAKFREAGGTCLSLPIDVCWNTYRDCVKSFVDNYMVLYSLAVKYRTGLDLDIVEILTERNLLLDCKYFLEKVNVVAKSLNVLQRNHCTLSEAYNEWVNMLHFFENYGNETNHCLSDINTDLMSCKARFQQAVTPYHMIAYQLDPKFSNPMMPEHKDEAMNAIRFRNPAFLATVLKFKARMPPFNDYFLLPKVLEGTSTLTWWQTLEGKIPEDFLDFVTDIFSCVASSAGLERLFSSYGIVHTKLQNKLGVQKAAKLMTIFKHINGKKKKKTFNDLEYHFSDSE